MSAAAERPAGVTWKRVLRRLEGLPERARTPDAAVALAAEDAVWPRPSRGLMCVLAAVAIYYAFVPFVLIRNARECNFFSFDYFRYSSTWMDKWEDFELELEISVGCYLFWKSA
mmetsp:Transcript_7081/g.20844  ORF Transcript_7081/g.20844 Transcript_7081/m.20844 type:complete len:114 (+) Transcript_7081:1419-1760(+)